jgi:hypothetical protein
MQVDGRVVVPMSIIVQPGLLVEILAQKALFAPEIIVV